MRRPPFFVVAALIAVGALSILSPATVPPGPSATPSARPSIAAEGPIVFYEVVDGDGSALMERRLDGQSLARTVARQPNADLGRTWTVDPTGTLAVASLPTAAGERLEAVTVADGQPVWQIDLPFVSLADAVWSADGRRLALEHRQDEIGPAAPTETVVLDTRDGRITRTVVPADAVLQGFDAGDALILRQRVDNGEGPVPAWRFLRIDPATNVVERLIARPAVGAASIGVEDVDPARGLGVTVGVAPGDQGSTIEAWPLDGASSRRLAIVPSVDRVAIDPAGSGVAVVDNDTIRFVTWDGHATELWRGEDSIADIGWAATSDYVALTEDVRGANLTVIELATRRAVAVPQAEPFAQSLLVRILGGVPLPDPALPAAEPTPTPTAAPAGPDLAGAPGLASAWLEPASGRLMLHAKRLVATGEGGMRIAAEIAPIDLGPTGDPDDGGRGVALVPRPGSNEMLIWVGTADRSVGWLWDGGGVARPLAVPRDWPANASDVAWRQDGKAIAASAAQAGPDGSFQGIFAVAEVGGSRTTVVPVRDGYDRLEGWWSSSELRVGHGICTEGCRGRYSLSARLRIRDGRLTQLTAADRSRAAIDDVSSDGHGGLVLSMINDDPADDIGIDWPVTADAPDGPLPIGRGADGKAVLVSVESDRGTDVYRIDDPVGRAVHGRLTDPAAVLLGHLPRRGLSVRLSPDERWAIVTDRIGDVQLVELATGRPWALDRDTSLGWWPG